jgi:6-phosphogluconolactonase
MSSSCRSAAAWLAAATLLPLALPAAAAAEEAGPPAGKSWVYVGTYTGKDSKGVYRCEFDSATGKLSEPALVAETVNPTFLAVHPGGKFLYAVGEVGDFGGKKAGAVNAYAIDPRTGDLKLLNQQSSGGAGPCYVSLDRDGKYVLVANYGGGSVAVLPVKKDGSLGDRTAFVQHVGNSVDKARQEGPHAHSINLDPSGKFAVVADLGLDEVLVYRFDAENGKITPNEPPFVKVAGGAGPRHFAFHKTKPFAYVINEMKCTINALHYTPDGKFEIVQTISTLPHEFREGYSTAEVQVHPSGKFVYGSNRGQNSIAGFRIDQVTGKLTLIGHQGEGIKTPRNFGIDPTGKWMIVGNQDGESVIVYAINAESGELTPTGTTVEVDAPVCIKFVPKG